MRNNLNYVNDRVKQQAPAAEMYLTVTYKLHSYLLLGTVYRGLNIIYTSNLHKHNWKQSASTFPV
jgi:hypothetical protein